MVEIRAALLPAPEPLRLRRRPVSHAHLSILSLRRGLVFAVALSLPVLGSAVADRFHGGVTGTVRAAAVPLDPPRGGTAARHTLARIASVR